MSNDVSRIKIELCNKLKTVHNDKEFVIGVMGNVHNDEDRQAIIDYIDIGEDVSIKNLILLSLHLTKERNKQGN